MLTSRKRQQTGSASKKTAVTVKKTRRVEAFRFRPVNRIPMACVDIRDNPRTLWDEIPHEMGIFCRRMWDTQWSYVSYSLDLFDGCFNVIQPIIQIMHYVKLNEHNKKKLDNVWIHRFLSSSQDGSLSRPTTLSSSSWHFVWTFLCRARNSKEYRIVVAVVSVPAAKSADMTAVKCSSFFTQYITFTEDICTLIINWQECAGDDQFITNHWRELLKQDQTLPFWIALASSRQQYLAVNVLGSHPAQFCVPRSHSILIIINTRSFQLQSAEQLVKIAH